MMPKTYILFNVELEVYINLHTTNEWYAITKLVGIDKLKLHHTEWQITNEAWADKHRIK